MVGVAAVFGISGVGKSWLASRSIRECNLRHVQAGELIRQSKSGQTIPALDQLRKDNVFENQKILIWAFADLRKTATKSIIFDGHSVVDADTHLIEVPVSVIEALAPDGLIFVRDDPSRVRTHKDV